MIKTKGCVYFFRHLGLNPVKIGFSEEKSPLSRFSQFKTFAPYGSELLGFIESYNPKELERTIHNIFNTKKLKGEWFEITKEEVDIQIKLHSYRKEFEEKTKFQIAWAKKVQGYDSEKPKHLISKEYFFEFYPKNTEMNKREMAEFFKVTRPTIYNWIKEFEDQL